MAQQAEGAGDRGAGDRSAGDGAAEERSGGRLAGKVVLIVGGTSGLGLSAARACEAAGARIAVTGRNPGKLEQARARLSGEAQVLSGDARDPKAVEHILADVLRRHGRLDALYHVAGGSGRSLGDGPLHEISDDGWAGSMHLNLDTVFYSNRAAVRQFLKQGQGGVVLNMASVLGFSPAPRFFSTHAYAAAKAGIIGFSRSTAAYYARDDIRVNVIAPALVDTPMAERAVGNDEIMNFVRSKQPLDGGRVGAPEDYDGAAVFLLSEESAFMTGQVVTIDGGWTVSDGQYSG